MWVWKQWASKKTRKILSLHLVRWPSTQAVWLVVVQPEDLDSSLDTQVMQDTSHFQRKEVILKGKEKASVICWTAQVETFSVQLHQCDLSSVSSGTHTHSPLSCSGACGRQPSPHQTGFYTEAGRYRPAILGRKTVRRTQSQICKSNRALLTRDSLITQL